MISRSLDHLFVFTSLLAVFVDVCFLMEKQKTVFQTTAPQEKILFSKDLWQNNGDSSKIDPVIRNGFIRRQGKHDYMKSLHDYPNFGEKDETFTTSSISPSPRIVFYESLYDDKTNHYAESSLSDSEKQTPRSYPNITDWTKASKKSKSPLQYQKSFEKPYHNECRFIKKWQHNFYPTCNQIHELSVTDALKGNISSILSLSGSWRSVWNFVDNSHGNQNKTESIIVFKQLHLKRSFDHQSFSYHQTDAMAMERLSSSDFVIDSYGFCGQTILVEWAPISARELVKNETIGSYQRLKMARNLARGLNHIHSIDYGRGKVPTLAHNDINIANLASVDSKNLKFNDFNLAVLLKWKKGNRTVPCGFPVCFEGNLWRSPEEIKNASFVNEKADVYALGNVLFQILTRHQPWTWLEPNGRLSLPQIAKQKEKGIIPHFPEKIVRSGKVAHVALYHGILACYRSDPYKRPTAYQLVEGFQKALRWIMKKEKPSYDE
eukprot:CAMPEP_0178932348 /NCGR_PEP_ID=MMETSP0786-20121207/22536_1 /TAXON_ID=186022 /ORGANISM="Thalassionema frauenfeldii, Strain CCMP 1798" /LENGTH=490 /DNA_ID=CAMNT_0020609567 /DNA_START=100 /DNA_END=1569 /DNA_ORIENTATION=+